MEKAIQIPFNSMGEGKKKIKFLLPFLKLNGIEVIYVKFDFENKMLVFYF
jgi:hypothetical protein